MKPGLRPFHIMAKPVSGVCNLDCRYCYYTMKPAELYPDTERFLMADATLESYTRQHLAAMPERCEFAWQGGEPLLAGKDFFAKAVAYQKEFARPGQEITNGLQTNGTLLDTEWCDFLKANRFLVGISLDGPAQVHDVYRRDRTGGPTFERAWAGLELLEKHGVEFNVLVTLNAANAPQAANLYRYFANRGVRYLQFIPVLEQRLGEDEPEAFSCSAATLGRWMLDVFEQWAARDVGRVSVRFIDDAIHTILYGHASTCEHSERCAQAHVLEFNGDLYACDHFVSKEWRLGNILETPLEELLSSPRLEEFGRLKVDLPQACRACEFLAICQGGCPKHHRPMGLDPQRVNHFCEGYRAFFSRALPELRRIAEYIARGELPPRREPAPSAASGTAPRRNDPCPCGSGRKFKNCCAKT